MIVQAYWTLKVDGSNIILSGDLAPPDECIKIGKSGKKNFNLEFQTGEKESSVGFISGARGDGGSRGSPRPLGIGFSYLYCGIAPPPLGFV